MQVTPELLEKYHLNLCNEEEKKLVEEWLLSDEAGHNYPSVSGENDAIREIWQELKAETYQTPVVSRFNAVHVFRIITGLAACIAVTVGIWYLAYRSDFSFSDRKSAFTVLKSVRTGVGERRKYELPDGTVVYLNSRSELRYNEQFTDTSREAWLSGEAFFEVAKDSSRPFTIHTAKSETRVLGTAFNLKAYADEQNTTLVVQEGKVRFSDTQGKGNFIILTANEMAVLQHAGHLTKDNVYANSYVGWKENKLVFNNQPLTEIVPILERWYGVKINIGSSELGVRRCTGTFVNPSLKNLMASMSYSMNFKYAFHNNDVIIY